MSRISELTSSQQILCFQPESKEEAIKTLLDLLNGSDVITDKEALSAALFEREKIMSTSIGLGIAIPHVRHKSVKKMTIAIGVCDTGIDYNSFDGSKVEIIILIVAPEGTHREYLKLLASIALQFKNSAFRESIKNAATPDEVYSLLKEQ